VLTFFVQARLRRIADEQQRLAADDEARFVCSVMCMTCLLLQDDVAVLRAITTSNSKPVVETPAATKAAVLPATETVDDDDGDEEKARLARQERIRRLMAEQVSVLCRHQLLMCARVIGRRR
jgi:hypothetical protein